MLIKRYEQSHLLFNTNFIQDLSDSETVYRGELVLIEGEVVDQQGRRKPPIALLFGAVLYEIDQEIKLLIGSLHDLSDIQELISHYEKDFSQDMLSMIFVQNIKKPMTVKHSNVSYHLIPLLEGIPWNEAIDELALEKSDFKGQSAGEKVKTLYLEMTTYKPKGETYTLEESLTHTVEIKKQARGPV